MRNVTTWIEVGHRRAEEHGDKLLYSFMRDGREVGDRLSFCALHERSVELAGALQTLMQPGDRALLLYPPGLEFILAFHACLYAGVVAVPAYPPGNRRSLARLQQVVEDARPRAVLTTAASLPRLQQRWRALGLADSGQAWLATDDAGNLEPGLWRQPAIGPNYLAFLQYTSGSTSRPKGVCVSHGNLLHNQRAIQRSFGMGPHSVVMSWLPVYHDMGLIGCVLQPLFAGASCTLMAPVAFLQSPRRWLVAVSELGATVSGGPNFAYELCVRKLADEDLEGLELGSWEVAFNGAEPVRAATLKGFADRFAAVGFRASSLFPCYGLAEATLFVSGAGRQQGAVEIEPKASPDAAEVAGMTPRKLVSSGRAGEGVTVEIVDPETRLRLAPGEIGEIWVSGDSVAGGYWRRPEESEETFGVSLPGDRRLFLRTGDLGFRDGDHLVVTGRLKDLIIIRGRNVYPQDLEQTAENAHAQTVLGGSAAFALEVGGEERVVMVVEVVGRRPDEKTLAELLEAVAASIALDHEVQVWDLLVVRQGMVPKTSSGKVRRSACRKLYQKGLLEPLARTGRASNGSVTADTDPLGIDREAVLAALPEERQELVSVAIRRLVASTTGVAPEAVPLGGDLFRLGLDSLSAVELQHSLQRRLGVDLDPLLLQQGCGVADLAEALLEQLAETGERGEQEAESAPEGAVSSGQSSLWFLHSLAPESAAYHLAVALRLLEEPRIEQLAAAFEDLVARHLQLGMRFRTRDGSLVAEPAQQSLDFAVERAHDDEDLRRRVQLAADQAFDLEAGRLLRARLIPNPAGPPVLVVTVHHIVADFWSVAILLRELETFYAHRCRGEEVQLEEAPSYRRYVGYEHRALERSDEHWEYWRERLQPEPPQLELPFDYSRPPVQTFRGASWHFSLPASEGLDRLTAETGATRYVILLAVFYALLHRLTGQRDLTIGTPVTHRPEATMDNLVGYCVNPVALRLALDPRWDFRSLLHAARSMTLEALAHRDLPFGVLADRLRLRRDPSRSPLFHTLFNYHRAPSRGPEQLPALALGVGGVDLPLQQLAAQSYGIETTTAQFDLALTLGESTGCLIAQLQYRTDLFDPTTVRRMARHYSTLLGSLVGAPDGPVAVAQMLSSEERQQLLHEWQGAPARGQSTLHALFAAQVARTPAATALYWGDEAWSYARLAAAAERLSDLLEERGVRAGDRVAVCLRRRPRLAAALLAVLRCGAAYVAVDPAYPKERCRSILEDSAPSLLLTEETLLAGLPRQRPAVVALHDEESAFEPPAIGTVPVRGGWDAGSTDHPAYVLYTSGSTGRPKGVVIAHRGATALLAWVASSFDAKELSGILASTSVCFDLSVFELFGAWCLGGSAVLVDDVLGLPQAPAREKVTLINSVPSAVRQLVEARALPSSVQAVNLAGEALPRELVESLQAQSDDLVVRNLYGPSEDTTYSTGARMSRPPARRPPIGRPVDGSRAYVLRAALELVPVGAAGELFLAGEGLAQGYLGRPAETARRFLPHPFGERAGERIYSTGDLVRLTADGTLDFLGRQDHQVKVRGFRIELAEVESALCVHPLVSEAVVIADGAMERRRLVAFVASPQAKPEASELRRFLRDQLPEYMLPSLFEVSADLPRTLTGKIDRSRLEVPGGERLQPGERAAPPRNPAEEFIAAAWEEHLGVRRVGIHDNFFELGGNSLLASSLALELGRRFDVELQVHEVFVGATVAELAQLIEERILDQLEEQGWDDAEEIELREVEIVEESGDRR